MRLTLSYTCCHTRAARDAKALPHEHEAAVAAAAAATRCAPAAAAEAFDWMNRQITWQSLLEDLEVVAWLAEGDATA